MTIQENINKAKDICAYLSHNIWIMGISIFSIFGFLSGVSALGILIKNYNIIKLSFGIVQFWAFLLFIFLTSYLVLIIFHNLVSTKEKNNKKRKQEFIDTVTKIIRKENKSKK